MSLEELTKRGYEQMGKKYLITAAQRGAGVNTKLLHNMDKYAERMDAEILILPMAGRTVEDEYLHPRLQENYQIIDGDYKLNNKLKISNFEIKPQQINPMTGITRFAPGESSFIFASPKQVLQYVANSYDAIPKAIMTTGAITKPYYREHTRVGRIAKRDHEYAFVFVEIQDNKYFHFRQVSALANGNFADVYGEFKGGKFYKNPSAKAIVVGDLHPYDTDPKHEKQTFEQIQHYGGKVDLYLHDTFNGRSISHHYAKHNIRKHEVYNEQGLNLLDELRHTYNAVLKYATATKGDVYIVASNHDEHLYRYLDEGRFIGDKGNDLVGAELYVQALKGVNPLRAGLEMIGDLPDNIHFIERDSGHKVLGYELGHHGDLGANGGRGSARSIEAANAKSITAHGHSAFKIRNTYRVGTSTKLRLDYNRGYSNWSNTNAVLYNNGTVQLLNTIKGRWHGK